MNTPESAAKLLVEKYSEIDDCDKHYDATSDGRICKHLAKACAIIAVDEIINAYENCTAKDSVHYYQEVKKEIEKL